MVGIRNQEIIPCKSFGNDVLKESVSPDVDINIILETHDISQRSSEEHGKHPSGNGAMMFHVTSLEYDGTCINKTQILVATLTESRSTEKERK